MRHRPFLPILLLAFALGAPVAVADPSLGTATFASEDDKDKKQKDDRRGRDADDWDRDRDRGRDDDAKDRGPRGVPPGHLPPPGECRVWFDGRPPGHQPPPTDCATARREAARTGGRVIYGDDRDRHDDDDRWDDDDHWDDDRWRDRFDGLDRNGDGYLSRREWRGDDRLFDLLDRNDDGRLSTNELRDRDLDWDRDDWDREDRDRWEDRFREMDEDRNGRLSRGEWWGGDRGFDRLDRNDDGAISLAEWLRQT